MSWVPDRRRPSPEPYCECEEGETAKREEAQVRSEEARSLEEILVVVVVVVIVVITSRRLVSRLVPVFFVIFAGKGRVHRFPSRCVRALRCI